VQEFPQSLPIYFGKRTFTGPDFCRYQPGHPPAFVFPHFLAPVVTSAILSIELKILL